MPVVSYKASGPALTDLLGGHVQFTIDAPPVTIEFVKAGRLRPMAVTGKKRLAALPDVPTFDEAGLPGSKRADSRACSRRPVRRLRSWRSCRRRS